jgi:hypothetical protein
LAQSIHESEADAFSLEYDPHVDRPWGPEFVK